MFQLPGGPFEVIERISALIAIFPLSYKTAFVERLAVDDRALAGQTAVGFLLHRDEPVALAAVSGLAAAARRGKLDARSRRWADIIRPWLSPPRRSAIDAALPPGDRRTPLVPADVVKATASVCDGSGASSLMVTVRSGPRYTLVTMMTKATGVAEAMLFEGLSKDKVTAIERECASSVQTSPVQLATLARLLELALGRNLACDALPPFALVQAVEAIGLDDLIPNLATPADIIAIELAGSSDCDGSEAIREAHERVAHSELAINWFEAGDRVDAILTTAGSVAAGERALLEGYLPDRRAFWAAQCARSALALRDRG